jgi:hypothetical protein
MMGVIFNHINGDKEELCNEGFGFICQMLGK